MSRLYLAILLVILIVISVVTFRRAQAQRAERKREAAYQSILLSYSSTLKIGMARNDVEHYLRKNGTTFEQMCCVDETSAFTDLVEIGQEKPPWMCSDRIVYVALQFAAIKPHDFSDIDDSDVLKRMTIFKWSQSCL
jgi:hypothetical protein